MNPFIDKRPPRSGKGAWGQNPIDAFILAKQQALGLSHVPKADKRTLIRRLTFDLHGLPPTPEAVEAFLADESEDAYEHLIDTLLASPRYGERWARHWLDVAHYGETHGYDKDQRRYNAWPYRDYVIQALNQDIPYSRFIEDQIAGDILYPDDPQSTVALGFLAAGPWDLVGHTELKEGTVDKRIVRNLDRDDMVTSALSTFTGLTVQCARCHDHKFDPIRQSDYYSLQAIFAGIDRADRLYDPDPVVHRTRRRLTLAQAKWQEAFAELDGLVGEKAQQEIALLKEKQEELQETIDFLRVPASETYGYHSLVEKQAEVEKWIVVDLGSTHSLEQIVLTPGHKGLRLTMPGYGFPLRFSLEIAKAADFSDAQMIVDHSQIDHHERTDRPYKVEIPKTEARYIRLTAQKLWKGKDQDHFLAMAEIQAFSEGQNVARGARLIASDHLPQEKWSLQALTDGFNSWNLISGEALPLADQQKVEKAQARLDTLQEQQYQIRYQALELEKREEFDEITRYLRSLTDSLSSLPDPSHVYAVATEFKRHFRFAPADSIRPVYRLLRGDTEQPQEKVGPGTVESFEQLPGQFDLAEGHEEGERRVALAHWMSSEHNAFTWRSIVNRVWQYHFGRGIVATPNDFGKMGIPPTHPELLDYLAFEFWENGQSLKWLHKLILTSQTYQQAAIHHPENEQIDSDNRFLWRGNRRALEAEAIRDGVLAVSGMLDLDMGGPSFDPFTFEDDHSPRYLYKDYDANDPASFRRAIYRTITRTVPDPFMTTLDCADPSQSVPVRNETVTALQALSALNNPFMVRQAAFFAERLEREAEDLEGQIWRGFVLAFQREPEPGELAELAAYAEEYGLAAACRLIFAMNEFFYVD